MTTIEYLSLPLHKRIFHRILSFIVSIPIAIGNFFKDKFVGFFVKIWKMISSFFVNLYNNFIDGDWKTRTTYLFMGFGLLSRGSIVRGVLYFVYQIAFLIYGITIGIPSLLKLNTFGYIAETIKDDLEYIYPDNSFMIMLNSIIFILLLIIALVLWNNQIKDSSELQNLHKIGKTIDNKEVFRNLVGKNYHMVLLSIPTFGLVVFTIIPLIFMILVAFTNYSSSYTQPKFLFDWVGAYNFQKLFGATSSASGSEFAYVFGQILLWTLVWAFFATFTNYFLGMIVAMIINKKGIKFKKLWRTILITTIAVPQFISLLFLSKFLATNEGGFNTILTNLGLISENIKFLEDATIAKITIIVVNMWIGIPYTMLMCSGILMNIPDDLYESARIDGASPFKMYMKITLPYMLFVTGPYLISNFVGNINNFNVIYLLSGGNPMFTNINGAAITNPTALYGAGQTDLLITWLYKMCMGQVTKDYGVASVIGIFVFVVVATFSLILYGRTNAVKNEGDFQ